MRELWRKLSKVGRLCLIVIAGYFALAVYGEVQYRVARARDITPSYNVVHEQQRYQDFQCMRKEAHNREPA